MKVFVCCRNSLNVLLANISQMSRAANSKQQYSSESLPFASADDTDSLSAIRTKPFSLRKQNLAIATSNEPDESQCGICELAGKSSFRLTPSALLPIRVKFNISLSTGIMCDQLFIDPILCCEFIASHRSRSFTQVAS